MQIYFHSHLCSYLPRVPILVEGTADIHMFSFVNITYAWWFLYCTNWMCYCPTPKLSPHRRRCISTFPQKTHFVWFISVFKSGDMRQCPHKSPSPCNTCHHSNLCPRLSQKRTHTHTLLYTQYSGRISMKLFLFNDSLQGHICPV